jgi:hypothetical protein
VTGGSIVGSWKTCACFNWRSPNSGTAVAEGMNNQRGEGQLRGGISTRAAVRHHDQAHTFVSSLAHSLSFRCASPV